ncbi:MAG: cobJ [Mycobacterium sp.]|nr:cobJ [Mycobacterium sp.]
MIGLVTVTAAGRAAAQRLAAAWPGQTRAYPVGDFVVAWRDCDQLVAFAAVGAAVRLAAPLLSDKRTDPALVCVDEASRHAVAVLGGHEGGGNALAQQVAAVLGADPVVTTASDASAVWGLGSWAEAWGATVSGDVAAVGRALLDGAGVRLIADRRYPWPALAGLAADAPAGAPKVVVTDQVLPEAVGVRAVVRPPSLVVGIGSSRGVTAEEVGALVDGALAAAGLAPESVVTVATVAAKADEEGILAAAAQRGWPVEVLPAEILAAVEVPNPSEVVRAAVGTPSVAEAAALAGGGELLVAKTASAMATVAVVRRPVRGRLALVGLGPGARDLLTPRAAAELRRAAVVVGLDQYVDQVRDLIPAGVELRVSGLGAEEQRAGDAVAQAVAGGAVALIGSGDAGVYAMASPALQQAGERAAEIDVVGVPGVTAAMAAASLLGAPLGHDHCSVSLSDLHTPWEVIEARVRAAAEGDFVVTFYNPRSRGRDWQLPRALELLAQHRDPETPVGVVHGASRPDERVTVTSLAELDVTTVDMTTVVVVGNRATRALAGRMVTPRGYRWSA